jgi:hypothetical protein
MYCSIDSSAVDSPFNIGIDLLSISSLKCSTLSLIILSIIFLNVSV